MIKVKAWDKINKKMVKVDAINYWSETIENEDSQQIPFSEIVLLRKSEYMDKNGKNIYEGDKLKLVDETGKEIEVICSYGKWERKMINEKIVEIEGFAFMFEGRPTLPIVKNYLGVHDTKIMEIIGNIYENGEDN